MHHVLSLWTSCKLLSSKLMQLCSSKSVPEQAFTLCLARLRYEHCFPEQHRHELPPVRL